MEGGAESLGDPTDQSSGGVAPPASVAVGNLWSEADVVLMASGGRVVECPLEHVVVCQLLE